MRHVLLSFPFCLVFHIFHRSLVAGNMMVSHPVGEPCDSRRQRLAEFKLQAGIFVPTSFIFEDGLRIQEGRNMEKPLVQGFVQKCFNHPRTTLQGLHLSRSKCAQRQPQGRTVKEQLDKFVADAHDRRDVYIIVPGAPTLQRCMDALDPVSQSKCPELDKFNKPVMTTKRLYKV